MHNIVNESEIHLKFLDFEKKHRLFSQNVGGVFFWKLIRLDMFRALTRLSISQNIKKKSSYSFLDYTFSSVFFCRKTVDIIVFENPRKFYDGNDFYDPYTRDFIKNTFSSQSNYQIVDDGYQGVHFQKSTKILKFNHSIYYDILSKIWNYFLPENYTNKEISSLELLELNFNKEFDLNYNLKDLVLSKIKMFKFQKKKYGALFDKKKCNKIYLVCSYGKEGAISAAKDRGIIVSELQHGIMGPYHMGYHFPGIEHVPYFPDKLLLFSKLWQDTTHFPSCQSSIIGFKFLNDSLKPFRNQQKIEKSVLIISQKSIAHVLIDYILKVARENKDYLFRYKLHPKELADWKLRYPLLVNSQLNNLIVDDSTDNIFKCISTSEYAIGVSSTSILECLMLDVKVILVNLPTFEWMSFLVQKDFVNLVSAEQSLQIDNLSFVSASLDKNYLFHNMQ